MALINGSCMPGALLPTWPFQAERSALIICIPEAPSYLGSYGFDYSLVLMRRRLVCIRCVGDMYISRIKFQLAIFSDCQIRRDGNI